MTVNGEAGAREKMHHCFGDPHTTGRRHPQGRCDPRTQSFAYKHMSFGSPIQLAYLVEGVLREGYGFSDVTAPHKTVDYSIDDY